MTKVSSRFLAVLMLAVLATTGVLTTSALAAGPLRLRFPAPVESIFRGIEPRIFGGGDPGLHSGLSPQTCGSACQAPGFLDAPPIRRRPYVDPVWK
jgi:hypothetical protein